MVHEIRDSRCTRARPGRVQRALGWLGVLAILVGASPGFALTGRFDPVGFRQQDGKVAEAIAAFPAPERRAALIAAGYPEELIAIQTVQRRSTDDFARLVTSFSREEQDQIWNLVRYPGLAAELARGGRKSKEQLTEIARRYPEVDRAAILEEGRERYRTWVQIYALELEVEQTFAELLSDQPGEVRSAFEQLENRPDLMTVLIDNIQSTTLLGAAYRDDPEGVEAHLLELHDEVAARRDEDERAWSEELADPELAEDREQAARAFAEAHGYEVENPSSTPIRIENHIHVRPYPYWFGYPYWFDFVSWYPVSVWSHVGFRFGNGHGYVGFGLPSAYFLSWYDGYYGPRHRNHARYWKRGAHHVRRQDRDNGPRRHVRRHARDDRPRRHVRRHARDDRPRRHVKSANHSRTRLRGFVEPDSLSKKRRFERRERRSDHLDERRAARRRHDVESKPRAKDRRKDRGDAVDRAAPRKSIKRRDSNRRVRPSSDAKASKRHGKRNRGRSVEGSSGKRRNQRGRR